MLKKIVILTAGCLFAYSAQNDQSSRKRKAEDTEISARPTLTAIPTLNMPAASQPPSLSPMPAPTLSTLGATATTQSIAASPVISMSISPATSPSESIEDADMPIAHELDVVTLVKPLRQLIIGYMGAFEYVPAHPKEYLRSGYKLSDDNGKILEKFGNRLYSFACAEPHAHAPTAADSYHTCDSADGRYSACHLKGLQRELKIVDNQTKQNIILKPTYPLTEIELISLAPHSDLALTKTKSVRDPEIDYATWLQEISTEDSSECYLHIWNLKTGEIVFELKDICPRGTETAHIHFSPDGNYIVCAQPSKQTVSIRDAKTFSVICSIPQMSYRSCEISRDGRYIAFQGYKKEPEHVADAHQPPTLSSFDGGIHTLFFQKKINPLIKPIHNGTVSNPAAQIPANMQKTANQFDIETLKIMNIKPIRNIIIGYMGVHDYALTSSKQYATDSQLFAEDNCLHDRHASFFNKLRRFGQPVTPIASRGGYWEFLGAPTARAGDFSFYIHNDTSVTLENNRTQQKQALPASLGKYKIGYYDTFILSPRGDAVIKISRGNSYSSNGVETPGGAQMGHIEFWDLTTGTIVKEITVMGDFQAQYAPDGKTILIYNFNTIQNSLTILDAKTLEIINILPDIAPCFFEFSKDGKYLACGNDDAQSRSSWAKFYKKTDNPLIK